MDLGFFRFKVEVFVLGKALGRRKKNVGKELMHNIMFSFNTLTGNPILSCKDIPYTSLKDPCVIDMNLAIKKNVTSLI